MIFSQEQLTVLGALWVSPAPKAFIPPARPVAFAGAREAAAAKGLR